MPLRPAVLLGMLLLIGALPAQAQSEPAPAPAPPPAAAPAAADADDPDHWLSALGIGHVPLPQLTGLQFTLIRQHLYPLHAPPYASSLSLPADGDTASSYTFGVYLGWEPIRHFQLYLDLEQFEGRGVGNVTGLASLTNGDPIRQGAANLSKGPYVARKYLRYVVPLGTGTQKIERAQDQLPGEEADTHLEFKLGTMAVGDDFDKNRYANSTRTQFENWSLFNNTAWDYAADTRGYSGGLMLAYVSPVWSLRYGIYEMPVQANGQALCGPITHCRGEQLELTWAQPRDNGLVARLLAYRNVDNGGDYSEAIARGRAAGTTPDIRADDRPGRHKYGFGLNLEQPLFDGGETGLFARLGWNDGRTESFAFTEVDRLVSFGGQVDGVHWWRPQDRFAVAYVMGGLSSPHQQYFANGGLGFVVGDGRINYGLERVLETYYRFQLLKFIQISPDFQYITHPGYNKDRGPASVIGFRVHLEY